MPDLRERFAEYRDVEVPDLWDRIEDLATSKQLQPTPSRRRRPLAVALAAFVVVLVAGSTLLLLRPGAETIPPVDDGPVTSAADLLEGWQAVEGVQAGAGLTDVVAFQDGFVGVGWGTGGRPRIWWSPDGVNWEDVAGGLPEKRGTYLNAITVGGPGLVAVGHYTVGPRDPSSREVIAVWVSSDGRNWNEVPHAAVFEGIGDIYVWDLASDGETVIAVGDEYDVTGIWGQAAVWTSSDGVTWTRIPDETEVFADATISSITRFHSGFVAVGQVHGGLLGCTGSSAAVWTSADGRSWTQSLIAADWYLAEVTSWNDRLMALGYPCRGPAGVWTSDDGITWEQLMSPAVAEPLTETMLNSAADVGSGVFVVGGTIQQGDDRMARSEASPLAWFTEDGSTWTDLAPAFVVDDDAVLDQVVATDTRVFVFLQDTVWVWGAWPPGIERP